MSASETTNSSMAGREAAPPRPLWHVILVRPETMTLVLLILGVIVASQLSPFFLDVSYILRSFTLSAEFAIVALVLTMVIIAGEIDLSPAANMALSACLFAYAQSLGVPMPLASGIGLLAGLAMGALNAFMVISLQLPSIIVTIGTLTLYRGLAQVIAGDKSIRVPDWFIGIDRAFILGVPIPVVIFILAAIVLGLVLAGTIFGGRGTILGTFLAAWLLVVVSTGMTVANLLPAIQLTVLGVLLIVAIIATNFIYSRTQR
ncbi:MAG: ABC transporter permease [Hyphomicrobiales bacterium]|nr:MAG: ABC transporter permease [Hyphomicrobiales bacterium]